MTSEYKLIESLHKELIAIQKREDNRHVIDQHLNCECRELLDETIAHIEGIVYYDPTPIH
jgi:hypothetical protein